MKNYPETDELLNYTFINVEFILESNKNKILKLNHLGVATSNMQKAEKFVRNTHNIINTIGPIWDPNLKANLQLFETCNGTSIELVDGPVVSSLIKKGILLYHFCYEVDDINSKMIEYKKNGGLIIVKPTPALLFENRLVAFINTPIGIIELLSNK